MFRRFGFEAEFYADLSRLPLQVRMKLDLAGVKIPLDDWRSLHLVERSVLCHIPADTEEEMRVFVSYLDYLSCKYHGRNAARMDPVPRNAWDDPIVPPPVAARSATAMKPVRAEEWARWQPVERYAVYKTALSRNDPGAFAALLDELRERRG
jgi:hypothetical protein